MPYTHAVRRHSKGMANIIDSISGDGHYHTVYNMHRCCSSGCTATWVTILMLSQGHEVFEGRFGTQVMFFLGVKTNIHDIETI